ncbi:MAG TPA: outer membrane lipoprotein carrier protein LolA [Longimicrobiales bacterium]|nr:outer membrane lipoprotein carrier protein LolA [Longimicrobiales bacterium]
MNVWVRGALRMVVATLLLTLMQIPVAAQDRGMEILQQASRRYAPVTSLCADFVQHLRVPLLGQEETARGRLCQQRPNLFAMRFTEPTGDVIVVDGESMWYYMPSNDAKQFFRFPIERGTGGLDFHREFLEDPEVKYDVTYESADEIAGTATHRLRLRPKERTSYRAAVLWIEQGTSVLRVIRLEEENGNERTINLRDVAFGATAPRGFFTFTPPPGALEITP